MARSTRKKPAARGPRRKTQAAAAPTRRPGKATAAAAEMAVAALAHDIRTPLTGILALAELLAAGEVGPRERGWALAIKSAAEHLAQMTTLVTDAVKADVAGLVLRREVFSPRRLAESVGAGLLARAQAAGLEARLEIAPDLPEAVTGDPVRLRAALENLIDNAVKFTAQGSVTLSLTARPAPRRRVKLLLEVADSGLGLRDSEIRRLFRPFSQASAEVSRRYGGTGLGLTLVRRLARAMGGELSVTSRLAEGSTFHLSVTVERAQGATVGKGASDAAAPATKPARELNILCVEDNPYGRVVLSAILGELGHRVDFAGSGDAALERLARGAYDAVLMDVTLPGMDGFEVTRRIRGLGGGKGRVPVIGISARAREDDETKARAAGMNAYLVKPVSPAALAAALVGAKGAG
jgi:CheY-like chemotaxis protein